MNNSQLFKNAHKKARKTVDQVGNYQIAFTLALRELIAENKKPVKTLGEKIENVFAVIGVILLAVFIISCVSGLTYLLGIVVCVMASNAYVGLSFFLMFSFFVTFGMVTLVTDEISLKFS